MQTKSGEQLAQQHNAIRQADGLHKRRELLHSYYQQAFNQEAEARRASNAAISSLRACERALRAAAQAVADIDDLSSRV
jgi:hypothetical protein